jgi:hypothetical protein
MPPSRMVSFGKRNVRRSNVQVNSQEKAENEDNIQGAQRHSSKWIAGNKKHQTAFGRGDIVKGVASKVRDNNMVAGVENIALV